MIAEQHIGGYLSLARQKPQCERSVKEIVKKDTLATVLRGSERSVS